MTREEAIARLKNTAWLGSNNDRESTEEAVRMAIEALNLQPTCNQLATTEGDLISRQAVVDLIRSMESDATSNGISPRLTPSYVIDGIESLPSADAVSKGVFDQFRWERDMAFKTLKEHGIGFGEKPRTGKWVKDALGMTVCSECRRWRRDNRTSHVNFCNSCGARMIGEEK